MATKTENAKIEKAEAAVEKVAGRKTQLEEQMGSAQAQLDNRRAGLGAAVLEGGDLDQLTGEISTEERIIAGLREALAVAAQAEQDARQGLREAIQQDAAERAQIQYRKGAKLVLEMAKTYDVLAAQVEQLEQIERGFAGIAGKLRDGFDYFAEQRRLRVARELSEQAVAKFARHMEINEKSYKA